MNFDLNQGISEGRYSILKIFHHQDKLNSLLEKKVTAPLYVRVKPSNKCNHNCFYCVYDPKFSSIHPLSNRTDEIPIDKMRQILNDFDGMKVKAVTYSLDKDEIVPIEENGFLKIVKIGDLVSNFDKKNELVSWTLNDNFKKDAVVDALCHESDGIMYKVTLESGRNITTTGNHSLYFYKNGEIICIEVKDAKKGDLLVLSNTFLPEEEIFTIDTSTFNNSTRRGVKNPKKFIVDKDFCRLLGYYVAEGHIQNNKCQLVLTFGKYLGQEKKYVDDVVSILTNYGFEKNLRVYKYQSKTQVILFSKWFNEMILSLNCGSFAREKRVPDLIFNLNKDFKKEFIKGLFAGDGNFRNTITRKKYHRNVLCLKTSSKLLTQTLLFLLDNLDIFATINEGINSIRFFGERKVMEGNYFSININRRDDLEKLRGVVKFLNGKLKYKPSKHSIRSKKIKKITINEDAYALKIKKIEKVSFFGDVYDISIKNSNRFITSFGILAHNSGGGEPLVHPNITEILKKTLEKKIRLSMITNGQALEGKPAELLWGADWIRVSLDYHNAEMFSKIRQKPERDFYRLKNNILEFAKNKNPNCDLGINCVVHHINYKNLIDIAKFCKEIGVDNLRFAPVWKKDFLRYHEPFRDRVMEQIEKAKELQDENISIGSTYERYFEKNTGGDERGYPRCFYMEIVPVIAADQNVYTCHNNAYEPFGKVGSIKEQSFKEMWFSKETNEFFKNFNPQKVCRHECSNDEKNRVLNEFINCRNKGVVEFI